MRRLLGGVLLLQVLIMVSAAVLAPVVIEGIGPDDTVLPPTEYEARARLAGACIGILVMLSATALPCVARWLRSQDPGTPWPMLAGHLAGAVILGLFGQPTGAVLLALAAATWWGLDLICRQRHPAGTLSPTSMAAAR